jgi:hypothetical protein
MCSAKGHVRFTPESDIGCVPFGCPLRARTGHSASEAHVRSARNTAARGRIIVNSVNSPGFVSTIHSTGRRDENNRDYVRWCFADEAIANEFEREFATKEG